MNKAVHYSWAQLVHDLYHGFVIILDGKTIIESVICISNQSYNHTALPPYRKSIHVFK